MPADHIAVKGARRHNLKHISVDIPHDKFSVLTGVSGSGKSTLAFDTVFAEGQRRFVESQSTYARQFLQRLDKPEVDSIEGLRPTIAVHSRNTYKSSRSTVGTVTEIYDYLRLVFAKIGELHCPVCGDPVRALPVDDMIRDALSEFSGRKVYLLAPMEISEKMTPELMKDLVRSRGYSYIFSNGAPVDLETADIITLTDALNEYSEPAGAASARTIESEAKTEAKTKAGKGKGKGTTKTKTRITATDTGAGASNNDRKIFIVVDRLAVSPSKKSRLADSFETALKEGAGFFIVRSVDGKEKSFTEKHQCFRCNISVSMPSPQELSFNSALGACPDCKGFGDIYDLDMDLIVPDKNKTLKQGAIECWESKGIRKYARKMFLKPEEELGVRTSVPFGDLTGTEVERLMHGYGDLYGLIPFFDKMQQKSYKISNRYFLMRYRSLKKCPKCGGSKLNPTALSARLNGKDIAQLGETPIHELYSFFKELPMSRQSAEMVKIPMRELISRTGYMVEIGLGYLTLSRLSRTLSGGEMQRIHLAGYLGSRLTGSLYILDEPTVGLHPRDTDRLIRVLKDLRELGNTIIVVEHDLQVIRCADHVIDMGPGPGEKGGSVVYTGNLENFADADSSLTADYLTGRKKVSDFRRFRPSSPPEAYLILTGASENNLKNIDAAFPVNRLTCVTGVSGSGKSTLVCDILYPAAARELGQDNLKTGAFKSIKNIKLFKFTEMMGQDPIGRTPRANALTYLDLFGPIRTIFSATKEARRKGIGPGAFSFNTAQGRCPKCEGTGFIQIDMQFLADVYVPCEECEGTRYLPNILEITNNGKNISEVLNLTVTEAETFFKNTPNLVRKLKVLDDVGLGYIRIGQPLNTLSGGEAQRLKIAKFLISAGQGKGLFIFDEPTMGLHPNEVSRFLSCVDKLILSGHTVIVIEHNLDVIAQADYIIDLGPEGGEAGGEIISKGAPADIAADPSSTTGKFLKDYLAVFKSLAR